MALQLTAPVAQLQTAVGTDTRAAASQAKYNDYKKLVDDVVVASGGRSVVQRRIPIRILLVHHSRATQREQLHDLCVRLKDRITPDVDFESNEHANLEPDSSTHRITDHKP